MELPIMNVFETWTKNCFVLKKKDTTLLSFELKETGFGDVECFEVEVKGPVFLLPKGVQANEDSLLSWLETRFIPTNRAFASNLIKSVIHPDQSRIIGLLTVTMGLSVLDDYWVLPLDSDREWKQYNLFDNHFSQALSLIAFTGYDNKVRGIASSPEFTTDGMLRKTWRRTNGKVYLYKGGTEGAINAGKEPYSEFYASQVAEVLGLNYVSYDLEMWKGILCSTCELFTNPDLSFVPAHRIHNSKTITKYIKETSSDDRLRSKLLDMVVFDVLIGNNDRHFGNFGFLFDNHNRFVDLAPIFDNGYGLMPQAVEDVYRPDDYFQLREVSFLKLRYNAYRTASNCLTDHMRKNIKRLVGFKFKRHPFYNLEEERLRALERFVERQAMGILNAGV